MKEDEMLDAVLEMGKSHEQKFKDALGQVGKNIFEAGMLPKDAFGITKIIATKTESFSNWKCLY